MEEFVVKDSGERKEFESGMIRDTEADKPRFDLVYWPVIKRWADHMAKGAVKYGAHNWKKAEGIEEAERFRSSLLRHLYQYLHGDREEDHLSAVLFNSSALEYLYEEKKISLPPL